jgi:hypothetical protein
MAIDPKNIAVYMRTSMEKNAAPIAPAARATGRMASGAFQGLKSFAKHPFKTMFWSRAPKGRYWKDLGSGAKSNLLWTGGILGGGVAASPFFTDREI